MRVFPNGSGLLLGLFLTFVGAWVWPNGALWLNLYFLVSDIAVASNLSHSRMEFTGQANFFNLEGLP